jgi:hypothetical protein
MRRSWTISLPCCAWQNERKIAEIMCWGVIAACLTPVQMTGRLRPSAAHSRPLFFKYGPHNGMWCLPSTHPQGKVVY